MSTYENIPFEAASTVKNRKGTNISNNKGSFKIFKIQKVTLQPLKPALKENSPSN